MKKKILPSRRRPGTKNLVAFSDRSGHAHRYIDMVVEPGTGLFVHKYENDGAYNRRDIYVDPMVPPDAQIVDNPSQIPDGGPVTDFF